MRRLSEVHEFWRCSRDSNSHFSNLFASFSEDFDNYQLKLYKYTANTLSDLLQQDIKHHTRKGLADPFLTQQP